jgi:phosphatidylethanolamine-binding protein (PEBP) family uncharacterized protein
LVFLGDAVEHLQQHDTWGLVVQDTDGAQRVPVAADHDANSNNEKKQMRSSILIFSLLFSAAAQAQMTIDYEWLREHKCSSKSPALNIAGIPAGATKLTATLIDNDVPSYPHGGGSVAITNADTFTIETGALSNYKGPCPPNFSSFGHDYSWTIRAFDTSGKELASSVNTKTFSSSKVPK